MTLEEASRVNGMRADVLIVWPIDDQSRRNGANHVEITSGGKTVCGLTSHHDGWKYQTNTWRELARRLPAGDDLCRNCVRLLAEYDFAVGREPRRIMPECPSETHPAPLQPGSGSGGNKAPEPGAGQSLTLFDVPAAVKTRGHGDS